MADIKEGLLLWFTKFLMKNPQAAALVMKLKKTNNWLRNYTKQLSKNLKKRTVYSGFKYDICGADLADMQLISKFKKRFRFYRFLLMFLVNILGLFL